MTATDNADNSADPNAFTGDEEQIRAWIKQAQDGSSVALGFLLDASRNYLLKVANRALSDDLRAKLGASDVVQETALDASRDFDRFEGEHREELLAWLSRILLNNLSNIARDYKVAEKRQISREVSLEAQADVANELRDRASSPSSIVEADEQQQILDRCLERCPEDMKKVIILRNKEHLSFVEIGVQMQRSADSARKLWARAIERLQRELRTNGG